MSDDQRKNDKTTENVDHELADLLDSALADFKKDATATETVVETVEEIVNNNTNDGDNDENSEPNLEEWNEEFIREAAAQFEASLATLLNQNNDGNSSEMTPEQIQQKFQLMAQAAQQVIENPTVTPETTDFASTISQTIQNLNTGAENLQNPLSEQDILGLFGNGGGGAGGNNDANAFLPFMQSMMQSLLSKDVLYPSLKDILDKFPDWLNTNRTNLTNDDINKYEKQIKLMEDVCNELEKEQDTDSSEMKKERFEKVLNLMQKLQDCGQPPADLVGDCGPPIPAELQNDPNQCCLM